VRPPSTGRKDHPYELCLCGGDASKQTDGQDALGLAVRDSGAAAVWRCLRKTNAPLHHVCPKWPICADMYVTWRTHDKSRNVVKST